MRLAEALALPIGRGTLLEPDAEAQLCPASGSLTNQLVRLYDAVGTHLSALSGGTPDLPPRRPHRWTLLCESEHPGWPLLALSQPPVIGQAAAPLFVRHLVTAHVAMEPARCREWARQTHERDGYEPVRRSLPADQQATWGGLVATILSVQAQHAMLHGWGILAAYVGLHPELRASAALAVLSALGQSPTLLEQPPELAATTLWATLDILHGGLPRPAPEAIASLARSLRTLPERTVQAPLPNERRLREHLAHLLPDLNDSEFSSLADLLYGKRSADPQTTLRQMSGLPLKRAPGQTAYWLRNAGQVQVITVTGDDPASLEVLAWRWSL